MKSKFRKAAVVAALTLATLGSAIGSTASAANAAPASTHVVIQTAHPNDWWL